MKTKIKTAGGVFVLVVFLISVVGLSLGVANAQELHGRYIPENRFDRSGVKEKEEVESEDSHRNAQAQPTVTGTISFSTDSFSATYAAGTPIPDASSMQILTFTNTSNVSVNYTITVTNQPAWLNSGYATGQLTLSPGASAGLGAYLDPTTVATTPGVYTTNIVLTGNFVGSPKLIPVTLTVTP